MADEVEIDQSVYDELIAAGKSERVARAKAKAAAVRTRRKAEGATVGPREASAAPREAPAAAAASTGQAEATGSAPAEQGAGGTATGVLTPEERQARVAAALAAKGRGDGDGDGRTAERSLAGQAHTHRLLAMVPPTGIQQVRTRQEDKVYVWPHLLASELLALLAVTAFLTVFSALVPAPLRELANANLTPNPSKAPWYFLGLQELLRYFHPMVAGVTIPGIGLGLLAAMPYVDKNPSVRPENRRTAFVAFTFFLCFWATLVIVGSFFRGPGFNFVWPWMDGLWFEL